MRFCVSRAASISSCISVHRHQRLLRIGVARTVKRVYVRVFSSLTYYHNTYFSVGLFLSACSWHPHLRSKSAGQAGTSKHNSDSGRFANPKQTFLGRQPVPRFRVAGYQKWRPVTLIRETCHLSCTKLCHVWAAALEHFCRESKRNKPRR